MANISKSTVLVIEDDTSINRAYGELLSKSGYNVLLATDGDEGIELAGTEQPGLIFLDVLLPNKTGWEVLKDLKSKDKTKDIPVVVMSNLDSPQRELDMKNEGAVEYRVKAEVSKKELLEIAEKHLKEIE